MRVKGDDVSEAKVIDVEVRCTGYGSGNTTYYKEFTFAMNIGFMDEEEFERISQRVDREAKKYTACTMVDVHKFNISWD